MRRAHQRGYVWCLAFDQDSEPMGRMLETLASIHDQTEYRASLGVIGANFIEVGRQQPGVRVAPAAGRSWVERPAVITAGSLYSVAAVGQVGSFREEFFLDHVDSDYCLRLRAHGYRVIMACEPLMTHALGRQTWHRFFGKRVGCSNHSPLRRYYNTRNRLVLAREYLRREPAWVLTNLRGLSRETLLILLFESEKAAKLRAMARGAWHAVTGRFENPLTS
jgi:rhamnosyltransferase